MTQPVSGITNFNSVTTGTLTSGSSTGGGLTATNVDGWDFTLLSSAATNSEIDATDLTSDGNNLIAGFNDLANSPLDSLSVKSNDSATFNLNSVDVAIDYVVGPNSPVALIDVIGFLHGGAVNGAVLEESVTDGGPLVHFDVSAISAFHGIDSFEVVANGSVIKDAFGIDNINASGFAGSGPAVTVSNGSASFTAGNNTTSTPVAVDSGVTVTDTASSTLASASVQITGNYHAGEDVLAFTNTNNTTYGNITASYSGGALSLSSSGATATTAQWQAALEAVTYTDIAITPNTTTRTISFTVNDGSSTSTAVTRNVTVADTDQSPIVTTDSGTAAFTAGNNTASTPIAIDSGITLTDLDNSTESSATVAITGNLHTSEDVLAFSNTNSTTFGNIGASYNSGIGILTLTSASASATLLQWQAALRAVTYTDSATTPNTATRTISFYVNDGTSVSTAATRGVTVTDTDQSPIVTTSGGNASFAAANNTTSTPVVIDSGVTVSDLDNTTQSSATVAVTGNFYAGEDVLAFSNTSSALFGNISASYNSGNGILTLTSSSASATDAQWANALDAVTYTDTAVTPNTATRTISFVVNDGTSNSTAATRGVTVTDTDQSPVVTTSNGNAAFTAGNNTASTPIAIDSGITLTDLDNSTESSATVAITGNLHTSEDVLAFSNTNSTTFGNISASYNSGIGILTLTSASASATLLQWQAALRAVTYTDSATTPNTATRTISFYVNDGTSVSTGATRGVTVADTDQSPILTGSSHTVSFVAGNNTTSTPVALDTGLTVTDADNSSLASGSVFIINGLHASEDVLAFTNTSSSTFGNISASYNSGTGTLSLSSSGATATVAQWQAALRAVTYTDTAVTPNTATRTVRFTVFDGTNINAAIVTDAVSVADTDQSPIVTTDSGSAAFVAGNNTTSTPVAIDSGVTVSDADNSSLASGTVSITGNFHSGEDVLAFTNNPATEGNIAGSYSSGTGVLTLTSSGATATIAQWQAAFRAVSYTDSAVTPNNATRTISFVVNDGTANSTVATRGVTVADTDQTPIVIASGGNASFTSGNNTTSTPIAVDSGITVSDLDNSTEASASVSITGNFHSGEDVLAFSNTNSSTFGNIGSSYDSGTGLLTLVSSGASATLAQWQAAFRAVTYTDTAVTPTGSTRTISFTINDGTQTSTAATRGISLTDTDQSPILTTSGGSAAFVAGNNTSSTPVAIDTGLTVTDLDNSTLASATVSLTGNFHSGQDFLNFTNNPATEGNIAGSYNSGTGVLTLTSASASATLAQWQAALRAVTYTDTAITPNNATRTISFVVNDGTSNSTAATRGVTVTDTDQSPIVTASNGAAGFTAGNNTASTPVAVDPSITVTDADNSTESSATVAITGNFHSGEDVLAFTNFSVSNFGNIAASYSSGVLTLSSSGATATLLQWQNAFRFVTYTDTATTPSTATRTISFVINDGTVNSTAATRGVTVTDTDQSPIVIASGGSAAFVAGNDTPSTPVAVDSGITVSDLDNPTESIAFVSISAGFHSGEDVLAFTNTNATTFGNITASYNSGTGVLTLHSTDATATVAQFQAALQAVTYTDTALIPNTATRTVSFAINDGISSSEVATRTVTVADTDQTPIVTTSAGDATFIEADDVASTPVPVDPAITVVKPDNAPLSVAAVFISGNFQAGEDVLGFVNDGTSEGNITGGFNNTDGVMTLISAGQTATIAQWQAALRAVTYTDTAPVPNTSPRTVSFAVTNGTDPSAIVTRDVGVIATHQTPIVTASSGTTPASTIQSSPVTIDPGIVVYDGATELVSATVSITENFDPSEDVLALRTSPPIPSVAGGFHATFGGIGAAIVGSYDATTGVLTLTSTDGAATDAQFQSALQSVTYANTSTTPSTGTRTISFSVNDGTVTSQVATDNVTFGTASITPATVGVYRFFDSTNGTHFFTGDVNEKNAIINPNSPGYRPDLTLETNGFAAVNPAADDPNAIAIYRFFDTGSGAHFFTSSASERDAIMNPAASDYNASYVYEPSATFYEHGTQQAGDVTVYRLFDSVHGTHFYTSDPTELAGITTPTSASYRPDLVSEGVAFYAPTASALT